MPRNKKKLKIFIIAGEVSGDVFGSQIMREMPDVKFVGIGGENMRSAGLKSIFPISDLSIMGVLEVLWHVRTLKRRIRETAKLILAEKPDLVLTVDSPGFARNVIRKVRATETGKKLIKSGLRFYHVVAPQVWAWGKRRAKKYAKVFDKLYAFFDFEKPYFTRYGLNTVAVGHPVAEKLLGQHGVKRKKIADKEKIITLVPGSRMSEVEKLLPLFEQIAKQLKANGYIGYKFVIPTVETTVDYIKTQTKKWSVPVRLISPSQRYDIYSRTYIAIVASGTVSAELAMLHIPTIVVYKMNPITVLIGKILIYVKWVSLVNILLNRTIYPEFLGSRATPENILDAVQKMTIPSVREKMIKALKSADKLWLRRTGTPSKLIAGDIRASLT